MTIDEFEGKRYYVIEESNTGHCCFVASVLDRKAKRFDPPVCETLDSADAIKIARALNRAEETST